MENIDESYRGIEAVNLLVKSVATPGSEEGACGFRLVGGGNLIYEQLDESLDGGIMYADTESSSYAFLAKHKEQYILELVAICNAFQFISRNLTNVKDVAVISNNPFTVNRIEELNRNGNVSYEGVSVAAPAFRLYPMLAKKGKLSFLDGLTKKLNELI